MSQPIGRTNSNTTATANSGGVAMVTATTTTTANGTVKKVFVQRDYTQGTGVRFMNKFPAELEGRIDRQNYEHLINTLNEIYQDAEQMSTTTFCESCFACISAYLLYMCMETYYQKCMRKINAFIEEQNDTVWKPRGLHITDPVERGLRVIEISVIEQTAVGDTANSTAGGEQTQTQLTKKNSSDGKNLNTNVNAK